MCTNGDMESAVVDRGQSTPTGSDFTLSTIKRADEALTIDSRALSESPQKEHDGASLPRPLPNTPFPVSLYPSTLSRDTVPLHPSLPANDTILISLNFVQFSGF